MTAEREDSADDTQGASTKAPSTTATGNICDPDMCAEY